MLHPHYPTPRDVDTWCRNLVAKAWKSKIEARFLDIDGYGLNLGVRHTMGRAYVRFERPGADPYYGYWQPVPAVKTGPVPLLVHLPGYGGEISAHPELVFLGYNVLHINPKGYCTPTGLDDSKKRGDGFPVMMETVESFGNHGYVDWLADAVAAVKWALAQPSVHKDRLGFFGSSQGGGGAMLLASLFRDQVKAVAADEPFLTNFPLRFKSEMRGGYHMAFNPLKRVAAENPRRVKDAWKAIGFVDTLSHAHRLTMPVLLTAGGRDGTIPADGVQSLFEVLPGSRSYTVMAEQIHTYTPEFLRLAEVWFRLYV
jgi:cephalosporin-C deacetylase-like acetyl esterase